MQSVDEQLKLLLNDDNTVNVNIYNLPELERISYEDVLRFLLKSRVDYTLFLLHMSKIFQAARRFNDAAKLQSLLIKISPKHLEHYLEAATNYAKNFDTIQAERILNNVPSDLREHWAYHYAWAMIPFYQYDFIEAKNRISNFSRKFPERPEGPGRLSEVAAELRDWKTTQRMAELVISKFPWVAESFRLLLRKAKIYETVEANASEEFSSNQSIKIIVINLDSELERLTRIKTWFSAISLNFEKVSATRAANLPQFVQSFLPLRKPMSYGVQGCFISHLTAWERVANQEAPALILEDDAFPIFDISNSLKDPRILSSHEMYFVNDRMCPNEFLGNTNTLKIIPIETEIKNRSPTQRGVGCDGYILTPTGAKKLLNFVAKDGIVGHVDWQLLAYCVNLTDICDNDGVMSGIFFETLAGFIGEVNPEHKLKAACVYPSLIKERDFGISTIGHITKAIL